MALGSSNAGPILAFWLIYLHVTLYSLTHHSWFVHFSILLPTRHPSTHPFCKPHNQLLYPSICPFSHWSTHLLAYPFVVTPNYSPTYLYLSLSIHSPIHHLFIHLFFPFVSSSIHLPTYPSRHFPSHPSVHLHPHLSVLYLSTYQSIHLSIQSLIHPPTYPLIHTHTPYTSTHIHTYLQIFLLHSVWGASQQ